MIGNDTDNKNWIKFRKTFENYFDFSNAIFSIQGV